MKKAKVNTSCSLLSLIAFTSVLIVCFRFFLLQNTSTPTPQKNNVHITVTLQNKTDPCHGRYIYLHDLPPRFNQDMLKDCKTLSNWEDMCKFTTNFGLGPNLAKPRGSSWYATNQFTLDLIFFNRMKQYDCLTHNSSLAAAIFVPFFAGFDIGKHLWGYNISTRDAASLALVDWLIKTPEWKVMQGRDHFLVGGRITWDFRRSNDEEADWGNKFLLLPAAKNMSMLVLESSPWHLNDFAIPYPTYFHPARDSDIFAWQIRMRETDRNWFFSFAGASRPGDPKSIRGKIIGQCKTSKACKLLECYALKRDSCYSPSNIMYLFQTSVFCLQPPGDSYTRRSAFDSILAGCIPVFFHPGSAYTQYIWHLPRDYKSYSVFISEDDIREKNVSIEEKLREISPEQIRVMRENVISLIPKIIYADPCSKLETVKDAFDVAVEAVVDIVNRLRNHEDYENSVEKNSWKHGLLDGGRLNVGAHEWDRFFS